MTDQTLDLAGIRRSLQDLSRGQLLIIAERAVEALPNAELLALLGDLIQVDILAQGRASAPTLLGEVRSFHATSLAGRYHESFPVSGWNCTQQSKGTDAFIAEFDRLVARCVRDVDVGPQAAVRQSFELLFGLLRHIDLAQDDVIFFADEGSSWDVGVHWRTVLPAYFRCLAGTAEADEFARAVDEGIADFAEHDRVHYLSQVRCVATTSQQNALDALVAP